MVVSTGTPCCGTGCASGYEQNYSDDFSTGNIDPGWLFFPSGASYENQLGEFVPTFDLFSGKHQAYAHRKMGVFLEDITHVENNVTILRGLTNGEQGIFLVGTTFIGGYGRVILESVGSQYLWTVRGKTPGGGTDQGFLAITPGDGDVLKLEMDVQVATLEDTYIGWDVNFIINGITEHTDEVFVAKTHSGGQVREIHCNLNHGLFAQYVAPATGDPSDLHFDDYNLTMT